MTVLVIVVTYNGLQLIDKCLQSVAQGASCFQTIVIDNGSEDGTPEHIRHNFPHVRIVETGTNHGFGKANNIGMKIAINENVDYIFLLNQDAWVEETTISNLVAASQRNPDFGILSPVHMNGSGNALDYGFLNYIARARCKDFISGCLLPRESPIQDVFEVPFINAALWLIPRRTVETVGGFNPFFFHYGEDRDYANRCRHFGLKIGFVPSEKGYHGRPQNDSTRKRKHQERRERLLAMFDPSMPTRTRTVIFHLIRILARKTLALRFGDARELLIELKYLFRHQSEIDRLADILSKRGPTFL